MSRIIIGNRISFIIFNDKVKRGIIRQILDSMAYTSPEAKGYSFWRYKHLREASAFRFIPSSKAMWDGKIRFLEEIKGKKFKIYKFPTGLLSVVLSNLNEYGVPVSISTEKNYIEVTPPKIKEFVLPDGTVLHEFQQKAVKALMQQKRCSCRIGTGGGKTEIICMLAHTLSPTYKTLIIAHRLELLTNLMERLQKRGIKNVTYYGDTSDDLTGDVVVASIPKLWSRRNTEEVKFLLSNTRVLIGDEVHHAQSATSWYDLMLECPAPFRFGFTATLMMADEFVAEEKRLQAVTGDLVIDIPSSWLIEKGFISKPVITMVESANKQTFISNSLVDLVNSKKELGPMLIMVKTIADGNRIQTLFKESGLKSAFVYGPTSKEERQKQKKALEANELEVLISSVIMKEGVDLPAIKTLLNFCDEKKHRSAVQIVGRALRGKGEVYIFDFIFKDDKQMVRRAIERMRAYAGEGYELRRYKAK